MKKTPFQFPMRVYERVIGILYIPAHAFLLPLIAAIISSVVGWNADDATFTLVYYAFGALFLLLAMNQYWRATIRDLKNAPFRALQAVILGFVMYFFSNIVVAVIMSMLERDAINPNTAAVHDIIAINADMMIVTMVLLAPIVEETMFRGALFGTIRKKSRLLAYVVSAALFAVYHLWGYSFSDVSILICALQYIPASIALAWCYEWSGTLTAPVVLHAMINLIGAINIVWR